MLNRMSTTIDGMTREVFQLSQRYEAACDAANADLPRVLPKVAEFLDARKKAGGLSQGYNAYRLLELYDWLLANRPKTIVELGSGATTLVFATYAAAHDAKVVSLEQDIQLAIGLGEYMPGDQGAAVTIHEAPRVDEWRDGFETCRYGFDYLKLPADIDLLYLDGPNNRSPHGPLPCTDAALIAGCRNVRHILVDVRRASVTWFQSTPIGSEYVAEHGAGMPVNDRPWYLYSSRHHTSLRRR